MDLNWLKTLLSQPTAPFREGFVVNSVKTYLKEKGVSHFEDPVGNIIVGVSSEREYHLRLSESSEPLFIFIAHMDHPGFHGEKWIKDDVLQFKWLGGSPTKLVTGAKLWVSDGVSVVGEGKVLVAQIADHKRGIKGGKIRVTGFSQKDFPDPKKLFGAFLFKKPFWKVGDRIYTKAADDLVGVATITTLATQLKSNRFLGLLSRAEEVGFIGTIGHMELGWLRNRKNVFGVSLETSRTLPGAIFGKGPVVRVGDRATTFDPGCLSLFTALAKETLGRKFQRRIMDAGTCEGTVTTAYGIPTLAISVPLGNYHNEGFEGGPECRGKLGPAPEFVHFSDVKGMLKLCEAILRPEIPWTTPWEAKVNQFRLSYESMKPLLAAP